MRKYESIVGVHKIGSSFFEKDDLIHVSEKIDGANASFLVDENGDFHYFSRNKELSNGEDLRGFIVWIRKKLENVNPNKLQGFIFYGEWVCQHKIVYKDGIKNTFILFDVYDTCEEKYLKPELVKEFSKYLNLQMPREYYYDLYTELFDLEKYIGVSDITEQRGEGIVIRNITKGTICKWVREDFKEVKAVKQPKKQNHIIRFYVESFVTESRVCKILYKGLDEGVYNDLSVSNFKIIMPWVSNNVVEDILKEEGDSIQLDLIEEFSSLVKKSVPRIVKNIMS